MLEWSFCKRYGRFVFLQIPSGSECLEDRLVLPLLHPLFTAIEEGESYLSINFLPHAIENSLSNPDIRVLFL